MKSFKNILGGTFLAGLMMVAADQARAAGLVIDNVLYIPLNISVKATVEVDGKIKSLAITEKEIISAMGLPAKTILALAIGTGDVWAINSSTKTVNENLTAEGFLTINDDETSSSIKGNTLTETGFMTVAIYSSPVFVDGIVDPTESEDNSADWIQLNSPYTLEITSPPAKKGLEKVADSYSAKELTGTIHSGGVTGYGYGTISVSGSGTLLVL